MNNDSDNKVRVTLVIELPAKTPFYHLMLGVKGIITQMGGSISAMTFGDKLTRQSTG